MVTTPDKLDKLAQSMFDFISQNINDNYFTSQINDFEVNGMPSAKHIFLTSKETPNLESKAQIVSKVLGLSLDQAKYQIGNESLNHAHLFLFYQSSPLFDEKVVDQYLNQFDDLRYFPKFFVFLRDSDNFGKKIASRNYFSNEEIYALKQTLFSKNNSVPKSLIHYFVQDQNNSESQLQLFRVCSYEDELSKPVFDSSIQKTNILPDSENGFVPLPYVKIFC